jgi:type IV secretory pathway VirB10-like protein
MTSPMFPFDRPPPDTASPVFARGPTRDPRITQPNSPWTMILGVSGLAILAVGVFTSLSHARAERGLDARSVAHPTPPAAFTLAQAPLPTGPARPVYPVPTATPSTSAPVGADLPDPHLRAPAMVVDLGDGASGQAGVQPAQAAGTPGAALAGPDAQLSSDEKFAARVSSSAAGTARATQLHDLSRIVPQGAIVPAVLETAIDSDLPGSVRAVVSRDVRSFDGAQVLIPRGSKLIGQYRSAVAIGQTRAFVVWTRLLTPTGISVDIGSPASDTLGRGGLDGEVNDHFFRRFGASILLTVLSAGTNAVAANNSGGSNTLIIGSPAQATNVADIALQKQIDIPTTIRVPQGTPVQVSVARDLDFSGVVYSAR